MKSLILLPLLGLPFLSFGSGNAAPSRAAVEIDTLHSSVVFKIKHVGASWFYGRFNGIEGRFTLEDGKPEDGSVEIRIDATSVDTNNERRDSHLRSPDFFDAKQFPHITFTSEEVVPNGEDAFEVKGELEMRGVKKPLTLTVTKSGEGEFRGQDRVGYHTVFTIQRSDFGVSYGLQGEVLGDEVEVMIGIEGILSGE